MFDNKAAGGAIRMRFDLHDSLGKKSAMNKYTNVVSMIRKLVRRLPALVADACNMSASSQEITRLAMMTRQLLECSLSLRNDSDAGRHLAYLYNNSVAHQSDGFNCGMFVILAGYCILRACSTRGVDSYDVIPTLLRTHLFTRFSRSTELDALQAMRMRIIKVIEALYPIQTNGSD